MSKINQKKFNIGYQKDENSVKTTVAEKAEALKAIDQEGSELKEKYVAKVLDIPYEDIIPNKKNRKADRNIRELADSILTFGLIHIPRVKSDGNGKYILTSGERRWRAIGLIRQEHPELFRTVPCTCGDANTDELDEEARMIIANNDVEDPSPEEYRHSIERLYQIYQEKKERGDKLPAGIVSTIAKELSVSPRQVQKMVSINQKLIPELVNAFDENGISIADASSIAQLDPIYQEEILNLFKKKGFINQGEIAFYKEEERKLREENAEKKAELDRLRQELNDIKNSGTPDNKEAYEKQIEHYKSTIDNLTNLLKQTAEATPDKSDAGKHMVFQNTIARLERAQNQAISQAKDLNIDDIEKKRLADVISKLNSLI